MYNFDQEPERRHLVDEAGLNTFLSKVYGYMALAVFVSALSAYLTMTVFASQMVSLMVHHPWTMWLLLLIPIVLTFAINFQATRNPVASFILLMVTAIIYGVTFAFIAGTYTGQDIASAFVASATVFVVMAILGTVTKKDLSRWGSYASAALIGLIVAMLINMFLKSSAANYIFSFIAVIIFTVLTAWDAQRMKNIYLQFGGELPTNGLAIVGALQLYLDFVNLFLQFLTIFGSNDNNN
ncbi:Bax inhibitor-1 family protein [Lactobacillus johnsonii]|uniref:Bax inhibitor-1/YccA family protein n=1 Tax=Lactobacillus johnsonii TaxID=33959 RepID=UPI000214D47E|nr:Bax inhibitor-1/YccA family protein [Lactobacillus johnsonii]MBU5318053.1 Bax inhibitor-1/YccA family protein [Lactobacillus johnsonii]MCI7714734.1 Bax inhibitor-1/YccA family protein [Lactobacillus johnsonii]MDO5008209.1 Bax inhibitor-1/YccA family protein [Lactobacillus johnsonii]MDY5351050.1 Bax inhibitor-1/YccA family protein [Lactobacillus johnsonii]QXL46893.1 Bax inhibitor-1/YccA family protein [Lactobacillus johnsonii]